MSEPWEESEVDVHLEEQGVGMGRRSSVFGIVLAFGAVTVLVAFAVVKDGLEPRRAEANERAARVQALVREADGIRGGADILTLNTSETLSTGTISVTGGLTVETGASGPRAIPESRRQAAKKKGAEAR